jgi:tRNA G10  N-methylase Trm11
MKGNGDVLLIPEDIHNLPSLQYALGGTVKTGWTIGEMETWDDQALADLIAAYAVAAEGKEKITFGISLYDLGGRVISVEKKKAVEHLGLMVKNILKETGRPVRFVSSKEPTLSSVIVETNHLLSSGGEFVLFLDGARILVGQTQTVQDFAAWSDRDYGRPSRDAKSGMLPPKLARIMINLAGKDITCATLLDPFCGSGTILMESALLECPHLIGSDISAKALEQTKRNMDWLFKNGFEKKPAITLFEAPAEHLPSLLTQSVDLIVTETYLGPPQKGRESSEALLYALKDIEIMLSTSLPSLHRLIKKDGVMILACPVYRSKEKPLFLPMQKITESSGWQIESFPEALAPLSPSGGLIYERPGQKVAREILKMTPI